MGSGHPHLALACLRRSEPTRAHQERLCALRRSRPASSSELSKRMLRRRARCAIKLEARPGSVFASSFIALRNANVSRWRRVGSERTRFDYGLF